MLTKEELIKTPEYWMEHIQNELYRQVKKYLEDYRINQTQLADKLKVTKGYVSQVLNGNFNYTLSKLIELSLAIGVVPDLKFHSFQDYIAKDPGNQYHIPPKKSMLVANESNDKYGTGIGSRGHDSMGSRLTGKRGSKKK